MTDNWTSAPPPPKLHGGEPFHGVDATVTDFWRFALADLRMNNARGYLAEFLVARAVGATAPRVEWDAYDVLSPTGIRIEVKSSAYLQVWNQRALSAIKFQGLTGRTWTPEDGESALPTHNADVYAFCVQTAQRHEEYDPLDVRQWDFYVLSREHVAATGWRSIGLNSLTKIAGGPIKFAELAERIKEVHPSSPSGAGRAVALPEIAAP